MLTILIKRLQKVACCNVTNCQKVAQKFRQQQQKAKEQNDHQHNTFLRKNEEPEFTTRFEWARLFRKNSCTGPLTILSACNQCFKNGENDSSVGKNKKMKLWRMYHSKKLLQLRRTFQNHTRKTSQNSIVQNQENVQKLVLIKMVNFSMSQSKDWIVTCWFEKVTILHTK